MNPPRTIRFHWEDFPAGSVREFGAKTVTREAVLAFASEFDPQPFHLDDEDAEVVLTMEGWGMFRRRQAAPSPGEAT